MDSVPFLPYGNPQPLTPLSRWIVFPGRLHGTLADLGISLETAPPGPWSKMTLGIEPPRGSITWKGTPACVCGPHVSKTNRSASLLRSVNMPRMLVIVADLPKGSGMYLSCADRKSRSET